MKINSGIIPSPSLTILCFLNHCFCSLALQFFYANKSKCVSVFLSCFLAHIKGAYNCSLFCCFPLICLGNLSHQYKEIFLILFPQSQHHSMRFHCVVKAHFINYPWLRELRWFPTFPRTNKASIYILIHLIFYIYVSMGEFMHLKFSKILLLTQNLLHFLFWWF